MRSRIIASVVGVVAVVGISAAGVSAVAAPTRYRVPGQTRNVVQPPPPGSVLTSSGRVVKPVRKGKTECFWLTYGESTANAEDRAILVEADPTDGEYYCAR